MAYGAILTGGLARRFDGRDKGMLMVGGRTILDRQVDALRPVCRTIVRVGGAPAAAFGPGLPRIPDRRADCGPLGGLDAALEAANGSPVILLACDMPFPTAGLFADLLGRLGDADAVVPRTERGYHPLCAVYGPTCREAVRRRLEAGLLRVRDLFDDVRVQVVREHDLARFGEPSRLLANVNTQADLDALESLGNH
jgi:molybdopterin-guanine dinucleotide biosynthesis protein A